MQSAEPDSGLQCRPPHPSGGAGSRPGPFSWLSRIGEKIMADFAENHLLNLSQALADRARLARFLVAGIAVPGHRMRSGTLWRKDVVVASEQRFPDAGDAQVTMADGSAFTARVAGRDPGTNVVALTLDGSPDPAPLPAGEPQPGGPALPPAPDARCLSVPPGVDLSTRPP